MAALAHGQPAGDQVLLSMRGVSKSFGGVHALVGVDLEVRAGEVHALLGENGAGKSTLIKCLAGALTPDAGQVLVGGETVRLHDPDAAIRAGIRVVYQELSLFSSLSVAENLLGRHGLGSRWIRWGSAWRVTAEHLRSLGLSIDPRIRVEQLPVGVQQMVEIARALFSGARVIVLDEPTSALSPAEIAVLFRFVHTLARQGVAFILITHFLEDVMQHADRVTVLRNGRRVRTAAVPATSKAELVRLIVGEEAQVLRSTYEGASIELPGASSAPVVIRAERVHLPPSIDDFTLDVHEGEVLGLYGDLASGHVAFAELLFGITKPTRGTVALHGVPEALRSPTRARDAGVGYIPGDRRQALALEQPIYKNVTLAFLHRTQGWVLRNEPEIAATDRLIDALRIKADTAGAMVAGLSGGNQQKVLFARWLYQRPDVLVLVEPTRGMDVGAKSEVIRIIKQAAAEGATVIVVSGEPETILALAERVLVARRGRIVAEFAGCSLTKDTLLEVAY